MIATLAITCLSQVTVTLPPEASVRGTEIVLGEIARIAGDDPAAVERAAALRVGYAPAPGYSRLLVAWRLEQELERAAPGLDLALAGSQACRVHPETVKVAAAELVSAARAELERALGQADASLRLARTVSDQVVPATGAAPVLRSILPSVEERAGAISVPVRILVDGEIHRTVWTQWQVERFEVRPVLSRRVAAGETIGLGVIENRRVKAAPGLRAQSLPAGLLIGSVARRDLEAGRLVCESDVVRPQIIQKGDEVYLRIRKGRVVASRPATATEAGALGDRVLCLTEGQRELMAVVVGRNLLEIDLSADR